MDAPESRPRARGDRSRASRRGLAGAVLLGIVGTIVWTYPLVRRVGDSITTIIPESAPGCADQILSLWIVVEAGRRLYGDPLHLFDANIFHPLRHTLAYSESMPAAGAVVAPLHALLGNPILAFNLYYLATLVLSFVGVFLLVREVTGDARAALLAGFLFAFVGDRWRIPDHLPAQSVHCIPWVLYFWIRCLSAPTWGRHLGLGLSLCANFLHSVYYGLMLPVLILPWAAVLLVSGRWPRRNWIGSVVTIGVVSLVSLSAYLPYLAVARELDYQPIPLGGIRASWYWDAFIHPIAYLESLFVEDRRPFAASPLALLVLVVAGGIALVRRRVSPPRENEAVHALAMAAFFAGAVLVSLGRSIDLGDVTIPGPFRLLWTLPGYSSFRGPGRALIVVTFAAAVLYGIGVASVLRRIRSRTGSAIVMALLAVVLAIDTRALAGPWPLSRLTPPEEIPPVYAWLASTPPETAVLELPYGPWGDDVQAMFFSTYHGRRLMNGYSARVPYFGEVLLRFPEAIAIRALQDAGVSYVLAHRDRLRSDPAAARRLAAMEGRADLAPRWMGSTLVLTIPAAPPVVAQRGRPLDSSRWRVTGSSPGAERAADGDLDTHWTTRVTDRGSFLRIDLGRRERLAGVVLRLGPHVLEYPGWYELWTSIDGSSWRRVGRSTPATMPPFASYRRDHLDVEVPLPMASVAARHLELRVPHRRMPKPRRRRHRRATKHQLLAAVVYDLRDPNAFMKTSWGVHEVEVYGPPRDDRRSAAPTSDSRVGLPRRR